MKPQLLSRSISLYMDPYYKCLIDILVRREGFESRSDFASNMLQYVFIKAGLWDAKTNQPTAEAFKRSPSLRRLKKTLDVMKEKEDVEEPSTFEGLEEIFQRKPKRR